MTSTEKPSRIRQDVSVQQIGSELLAYDGRRHLAFCLNPSSATVWHLADGTRTIAEITEAASVALDAGVGEELVRFVIETLRSDGLIEPRAAGAVEAMPCISRRAMLQQLGVGGAMLLPVVASIVAPTAAQAYSGCVDCSESSGSRAARNRKLLQGDSSPSGSSQP